MRVGVLGILALVGSAQAVDVQIEQFQLIRGGGGQIAIDVTLTPTGAVNVKTSECAFKKLSEKESRLATFEYKGTDVKDAVAILENTATLAEDHTPRNPSVVTGTWTTLVVTYGYEISTRTGVARRMAASEIKPPLVLVEGRLSSILSNIETEARAASASVCP